MTEIELENIVARHEIAECHLKSAGRIRRVGPDKGGHWEVIIKWNEPQISDMYVQHCTYVSEFISWNSHLLLTRRGRRVPKCRVIRSAGQPWGRGVLAASGKKR